MEEHDAGGIRDDLFIVVVVLAFALWLGSSGWRRLSRVDGPRAQRFSTFLAISGPGSSRS